MISSEVTSGSVEDAAHLLRLPRSQRVARVFKFTPFDYQRRVLDEPTRRKLWVCGRQVGKTETASVIPADRALTTPGEDTLICARYQETADELFRRTKGHLERVAPLDALGVTKPNAKTYKFANGHRILSRTLGNDGSQQRGKVPSCIVVEEAALVETDVYDKVLRPMFATHTDYELILITTPRGKSGYVWGKWREAETSSTWARFRNPTPDNPLVTEQWLEEERAEVDSLTWEQEYLGIFVEAGDVYLPTDTVEPCIAPQEPVRAEGARVYLAIDPARSGADRSVYLSLDELGNVYDITVVDRERSTETLSRIAELNDRYGYDRIILEENSIGGSIYDFARREGLDNIHPFKTTLQSKEEIYQLLRRELEAEALQLPDDEDLIEELTSLQYGFSSNGHLQVNAPDGEHDDRADALALGVYALDRDRNGGVQRSSRSASPPSHRSRRR